MADTQNPNPLIEPNFRWVTAEGRPTTEFFQYLRALDRTTRTVVGVINTPDVQPTDLRNVYMEVACSDEVVPLAAGSAKVTFRLMHEFILSEVRASLKVAQSSGSIFTVDINSNGASVLSTKLTIDNGEKTSVTAATPAVVLTTNLPDDAEITVDIDQVGGGTAIGLKIALIGKRPQP